MFVFFQPNQKGFALLSVFAVLLVTSLFVTFVISTQIDGLATSHLSATEKKAEVLRLAINAYKENHITASYVAVTGAPGTLSALVTDTGDVCVGDNTSTNSSYLSLQGWCGPYVDQKVAEDPLEYQRDGWGNVFSYNSGTEVITSFGPNGIDNSGGGDDLVFSP